MGFNEVLDAALNAVGKTTGSIIHLRELGTHKDLEQVLSTSLDNYLQTANLYNNVLSKVKAEGQFNIDVDNVEINWETDFFNFHYYSATRDYAIDSLLIRKEDGVFCLSTYTSAQLKDTKNNSFDDLKAVAESTDTPFDVSKAVFTSKTASRNLVLWSLTALTSHLNVCPPSSKLTK
ncbi:MAG: hypothetical protein GX799_10235 [Crenarchaeota archaeon]|nr:hypothetical protein [Thermoproteota archaeon]